MTISIDDVLLQDGTLGRPVVVLAGSLAAAPAMWDTQVREWSRTHRVLRVRYPGHGGRAADPEPRSMAELAAQLQESLQRAGVKRFAFCGLSLGGMLGLQMAAHGAGMHRLVVGNCRWFQDDATRAMWEQRIAAVATGGTAAIAEPTLGSWFTEAFARNHPDVVDSARTMILSTSAAGYIACARMVQEFDSRSWVRRIGCPVMIIAADQDRPAPAEHLAALDRELKDSRLLALRSCAHLSCMEASDVWTRDAGDFLLSGDAAGSE